MLDRYSYPEMKEIWSPENRFQIWTEIEILACEAWSELGKIPREDAEVIRKRASFDLTRIQELEAVNKHEVIAFLESMKAGLGPEGRYVHFGLTSSDVMDTATSVQLASSADLLLSDLEELRNALRQKAQEHRNTLMIGRTHGVHAEPITFGLKLLLWLSELERQKERLGAARRTISVGKISGAVGTYAMVDPRVEAHVCKNLRLDAAPVSSQIIQRDRHAQYVLTLALVGASIEKIATEIRHLQRTEVMEAEEPFTEGQKGSSAMPHKRNPVLCERICGLARILRSHASVALENVALWHERDISHSSAERIILSEGNVLLDYMLRTMTQIVTDLVVYPERMRSNLDRTGGLVFSQRVLLALIDAGLSREDAYGIVQSAAMQVWKGEGTLLGLLEANERVTEALSSDALSALFDPKAYLNHVDEIFSRFGI
ncbi:MAG: adenylosuccinate lyase [Armatimonadetes bacterium]|nr:adenylosuccinate lyase [Armatimonadota bacterium]